MTPRRRFLAFAAVMLPGLAFAQKVPVRIGLLWLDSPEVAHLRRALFEGLRSFGHAEGRDLIVDDATADSYEKLVQAAKGVVQREPSVIVVWGNTALRAARAATTRVPIVMIIGVDPVKAGFAASLARPGGNVTGITMLNAELQRKQAELMRETLPRARRVAAILDPTSGAQTGYFDVVEAEAHKLGIQFERFDIRSAEDLEPAVARAAKGRCDALYIIPSSMFQRYSKRIGELALKYRLPSFGYSAEFTDGGVLLAYGANRPATFRRAAGYVDRVLRGSLPADMPIELSSEFELILNQRTARALGLTIPPSVLLRATRMID